MTPIRGKGKGENVVIRNTEYWIGSEVTVFARRGLARARLRPQLEFRRALGRDLCGSIGAADDGARGKTRARRSRTGCGFAVHMFTALGAALA